MKKLISILLSFALTFMYVPSFASLISLPEDYEGSGDVFRITKDAKRYSPPTELTTKEYATTFANLENVDVIEGRSMKTGKPIYVVNHDDGHSVFTNGVRYFIPMPVSIGHYDSVVDENTYVGIEHIKPFKATALPSIEIVPDIISPTPTPYPEPSFTKEQEDAMLGSTPGNEYLTEEQKELIKDGAKTAVGFTAYMGVGYGAYKLGQRIAAHYRPDLVEHIVVEDGEIGIQPSAPDDAGNASNADDGGGRHPIVRHFAMGGAPDLEEHGNAPSTAPEVIAGELDPLEVTRNNDIDEELRNVQRDYDNARTRLEGFLMPHGFALHPDDDLRIVREEQLDVIAGRMRYNDVLTRRGWEGHREAPGVTAIPVIEVYQRAVRRDLAAIELVEAARGVEALEVDQPVPAGWIRIGDTLYREDVDVELLTLRMQYDDAAVTGEAFAIPAGFVIDNHLLARDPDYVAPPPPDEELIRIQQQFVDAYFAGEDYDIPNGFAIAPDNDMLIIRVPPME